MRINNLKHIYVPYPNANSSPPTEPSVASPVRNPSSLLGETSSWKKYPCSFRTVQSLLLLVMSLQNNRGESRERSEKREERKRGGRQEADKKRSKKRILTGKRRKIQNSTQNSTKEGGRD